MEDQPSQQGVKSHASRLADFLPGIYERLLSHYGPQHWWPGETRFEIVVGAILTQSIAWSNVEKAIANLKAAQALEPAALHSLPAGELANLIRPAGYYNAKAHKIKAFVAHLHEHYQYDLNALLAKEAHALRSELLSICGIGPETADSIILYAAEQPVFVVDAYTRRLLSRLGLTSQDIDYGDLQAIFEDNLPRQISLFQEYHALIVCHGKLTCRKKPLCETCPLLPVCGFGRPQI
jgi:endonuclease-3 related protein